MRAYLHGEAPIASIGDRESAGVTSVEDHALPFSAGIQAGRQVAL
jgi:hypothetical protein